MMLTHNDIRRNGKLDGHLDPCEEYRDDPTFWSGGNLEVKTAQNYPYVDYLVKGWVPLDEKPKHNRAPIDLGYLDVDLSNRITAIRQYMQGRDLNFVYEDYEGERVYLSFDLTEDEQESILAQFTEIQDDKCEEDLSTLEDIVSAWSSGSTSHIISWYGFTPEFQIESWNKVTGLVCNLSPFHKELYSIIEALSKDMQMRWHSICDMDYMPLDEEE